MFRGKKVSLALPAYNEAENIARAIDSFKKVGIIDEIIIVDNNSTDKTGELAKKKNVKVVNEIKQGYGFALRRGLKEATGYYMILSEPDGTFRASDSAKLLAYIEDYDMVAGTRTNPSFFTKDANMGYFLRFGNIVVAKIIQFLYRTSPLTDCGCTFRVLKRPLVNKLLPLFTVGGQHFLVELVVLTAVVGGSIYETPTHYKKRVGKSKITGSLKVSILVGLRMLGVIFSRLIYKPKFN